MLRATAQSTSAPEIRRMAVNDAASMPVSFSAMRQSSELPAKEAIAPAVRKRMRNGDMALHFQVDQAGRCFALPCCSTACGFAADAELICKRNHCTG
ncbi:hypothetical protein IWX87_000868 [Polaromonas sp. CG_9.7]|nr:hypothetical protein [Polaromonas sp. CG_9.7]MBG6113121.1 hypothetical protein [Polaromonas sp. CG_9.2]